MTIRVGLVGCVATKAREPRPARDLYVSALFRGRRRYVERSCERWFILSAKHGLVEPKRVLEPYDDALRDVPTQARRRWSDRVLADLRQRVGRLGDHTFEIHAGGDYRNFGLVAGLHAAGAKVEIPTEGLDRSKQLAFYKSTNARESDGLHKEQARQMRARATGVPPGAKGKHLADFLPSRSRP